MPDDQVKMSEMDSSTRLSGTFCIVICWLYMENHDSDRILLIDDDPMVRLMAVLTQYDKEHAALAAGEIRRFDPPSFASIFDARG